MKPLFDAPKLGEEALRAWGKLIALRFSRGRGRLASPLNDFLAELTPEELGKVNRADFSQRQRKSLPFAPKESGRPRTPDEVKRRAVELVREFHAKGVKLTLNSANSDSAFQEAAKALRKEDIKLSDGAIRNIWQKNKDRFPGENFARI